MWPLENFKLHLWLTLNFSWTVQLYKMLGKKEALVLSALNEDMSY